MKNSFKKSKKKLGILGEKLDFSRVCRSDKKKAKKKKCLR